MLILFCFLLLLLLLILGVPVMYCFASVIIILSFSEGYSALGIMPSMYGKISNVVLLAIPLFIMAGGVMGRGRIADVLVDLIQLILGRVKGSLAIVSVLACGIFGSICGSGAATLSCIGSIMLPKMNQQNYPPAKSAAIICCAAPLGLLIPPSAGQILVAWSGNLSVLACFLSTVVPGLILMTLLSVTSYFMLRREKNLTAGKSQLPPAEFSRLLLRKSATATPALLMPVIILGGIYGGFMTPTEAAAVAVFYSIPVAMFIYRGCSLKQLKNIFLSTATTTGVVIVMCAMIMALSHILVMQNIPTAVLGLFSSISDNKYVILLMVNLFLVFIGMIMDDTCGLLLCTPLLLPLFNELGFSPYQFAAIIGVNLGMGNITPPTAPFIYISSQLAGVNSMGTIRHSLPLLLFAYLPTLLLTTYVPQIATWLPNLYLGAK